MTCRATRTSAQGSADLFERRFTEEQSLNKKGGYELFRQIDANLKSNLYTPLSMNDLAAAFHVSPSYISRVMKKHSNTTLMQYVLATENRRGAQGHSIESRHQNQGTVGRALLL